MKSISPNKKYFIAVLIIFIILISGFSTIYYFYIESENNKVISETVDGQTFNDTISPIGTQQAVTIEIRRIHKKGIENEFKKVGNAWKKKPIFHFVAIIDGAEWTGKDITDWDTGYIGWEAAKFVNDEQGESSIEIQIIETKKRIIRTIDTAVESFSIEYDFRTGRWSGDDYFNDSDGYGHYNGENYEIWFYIHQLDVDGDDIPFWVENNTNPYYDDSKSDPDQDGIPTTWEWKWGYDPFTFDNHSILDPDLDGIENIEEYKMEKWCSNPFYKDIFIEVDFMKKKPGILTRDHILFKESQWMVVDKFSEHDISLHIDDGWPGGPTNGGGEYLDYYPDRIDPTDGIGSEYYKYHFPEERHGIFRYIFIQSGNIGWNLPQTYQWLSDVISLPFDNEWFLKAFVPPALTPKLQRMALAVVFMHELGHSLGLTQEYSAGIDNASQVGRNQLPFFKKLAEAIRANQYWDNYESVMSYYKFSRYLIDYSDGSHGEHDSDDWGHIDLTYFEYTTPDKTYGIGDNFRNRKN